MMEASQSGNVSRELDPDVFDKKARVYGSRWVKVGTADGGSRFQEVPLRWEDLFDPLEGDHVMHGNVHNRTVREAATWLDSFFEIQGRHDVLVWDRGKMLWKNHSIARITPDIAIIPGLKDPKRYRESFDEKQEGRSPVFVLEVTSKTTAEFDREDKPVIYRQAGLQESFMLDQLKSPWELSGERLDPETGEYVEVKPDEQGRYLAETLGVYFRVAPGGKDLILEEATTGEVIRKLPEESKARREAELRADQEAQARTEAEAKVQELLAEIERLKSVD